MGGVKDAIVTEILVKAGERVEKDASLLTLEGDKATMEVPAPKAGTIKEIKFKVGDKLSEGDEIFVVELDSSSHAESLKTAEPAKAASIVQTAAQITEPVHPSTGAVQDKIMRVPDLGGAKTAIVVEILVKPGDSVTQGDSIVTLEGDKATMEIPSAETGTVKQIKVKVGDALSEGHELMIVEVSSPLDSAAKSQVDRASAVVKTPPSAEVVASVAALVQEPASSTAASPSESNHDTHAGPGVRRFARELGVDLSKVVGQGRKGRILLEDVQAYVKSVMKQSNTAGASSASWAPPAAPQIDFSRFGDIEIQPLIKIKRLTGQNTHRSWITVPHVTQFDEADITELEAFREAAKKEAEQQGYKLTPLIFIMKAVVAALKKYPSFNASLSANGEDLILKKYYHIGVAVDTPNGLVVPVIRDVNQKGLSELAVELAQISKKAREKGLSMNEMQGSCFTISSLGGIGGTAFTPIVNAPDVAILGVSKAQMKPVYQQNNFVPRLMLPLSLSYDHRVIDGAEAARFITYLSSMLSDIRRLLI